MNTNTLHEKLSARLAASREIQATLLAAIVTEKPENENVIAALYTRIRLCSQPVNHAIVEGIPSEHSSEKYNDSVQFWECGSKLCPSCLSRYSRRSRAKLRQAIERQKPRTFERLYFITLTIKNPSLSLLATREIVNRSWTLFRKRSVCVALIRGGSKSEEFTVTANGFHYHLHLLVMSRYLHYQEIRRAWTECVEKAFSEHGLKLDVDTADGLLWVVIKPVFDRKGIVFEVCKYLTKSDSWLKIPAAQIIEVASVERWPRMFELFGSFAEISAQEPIVHTKGISDGLPITKLNQLDERHVSESESWRIQVERLGLFEYFMQLQKQVNRANDSRLRYLRDKWPDAIFHAPRL